MGLGKWEVDGFSVSMGERAMLERANEILGFA